MDLNVLLVQALHKNLYYPVHHVFDKELGVLLVFLLLKRLDFFFFTFQVCLEQLNCPHRQHYLLPLLHICKLFFFQDLALLSEHKRRLRRLFHPRFALELQVFNFHNIEVLLLLVAINVGILDLQKSSSILQISLRSVKLPLEVMTLRLNVSAYFLCFSLLLQRLRLFILQITIQLVHFLHPVQCVLVRFFQLSFFLLDQSQICLQLVDLDRLVVTVAQQIVQLLLEVENSTLGTFKLGCVERELGLSLLEVENRVFLLLLSLHLL